MVTLHTAKQHLQNKRHNRYMKEKLIFAGEGLQEGEHGIVGEVTDIENPDTQLPPTQRYSLNSSYISDSGEPFDLTNNNNRVSTLSNISGLSNVSGVSAVSSSMGVNLSGAAGEGDCDGRVNSDSLSGSRKGSLATDGVIKHSGDNTTGYGTIVLSGEDVKNENTVDPSQIQVQVTWKVERITVNKVCVYYFFVFLSCFLCVENFVCFVSQKKTDCWSYHVLWERFDKVLAPI